MIHPDTYFNLAAQIISQRIFEMKMKVEKTIYIQLLNEGLITARPAYGQYIEANVFRVLQPEDYDPEDEEWEFVPGSIVRCQETDWGDGRILYLAVEKLN